MSCGRCGHDVSYHGRRGFGSCSRIEPNAEAREKIEEWQRDKPSIAGDLAKILLALPGYHADCKCKRFLKRPLTERAA